MVPSSPQYFSVSSHNMKTVLFSWTTPLHPRLLTNYTLVCVPLLAQGVAPLMMTYSEAGSYTLGGFRPATAYSCSIVATNSIGNSAPSAVNVITVDECEFICCS